VELCVCNENHGIIISCAHISLWFSINILYFITFRAVLTLPGIFAMSIRFNSTSIRFDIFHLTAVLIDLPLLVSP